jgi:transcriptional regulator with XRE-family HTH domain
MPKAAGWDVPNLEKWRRYRVLAPKELADKSGVPLSFISRLEHGRAKAGPVTLDKLAKALRITREQLVREDPTQAKHRGAA